MPFQRTVPVTFRASIEKEVADVIPLIFITITHPSLYDAIRVVSDPEDFTLDGKVHTGYDFKIELLNDNESPPTAQLTIQAVSQHITDTLLLAVNPPQLELQLIAADQFTLTAFPRTEIGTATRIYRAQKLYLTDTSGDKLQVTGTLRSWDYSQETWPALRATEARFPGLYW